MSIDVGSEGAHGDGLGFEVTTVGFGETEQNASVYHPEVRECISEMESLNKESLLVERGMFDKVFGRPQHSEDNDDHRKGTFLYSFTQSGHQTEDITVLDQHSVALKIECKPANYRHMSTHY